MSLGEFITAFAVGIVAGIGIESYFEGEEDDDN